MADRVPVTIRLGGALPRALLPELVAVLAAEALRLDNGDDFDVQNIPSDAPLAFSEGEVSWGHLEQLEQFCLEHHLPFVRWCGSYPGAWTAERLVYDGTGEPVSFTATDDDQVVINRAEARSLGSVEAIEAHFASAQFSVPPLTIIEPDAPPGPMILRQRGYPDDIVGDLADASRRYCERRDASGLGASGFPDGSILVDGEPIARISYNGRIWPPGPWDQEREPLYDNRTVTVETGAASSNEEQANG